MSSIQLIAFPGERTSRVLMKGLDHELALV
jgi:hypothetical protein